MLAWGMKYFSRPHTCNLLGEFWHSEQVACFAKSDASSVKDIVGHAILMCGFSPDFFKRKTLIHHYPLCVVGLFYHCPSPRGVPLFASMETRFTSFGEGGECSVLRRSAPVPSGCRRRAGPEPDTQVGTDVLGAEGSGQHPLLGGL